jgi:VanZ family protein
LPARHIAYEEPWDLFRWDKAVHFSLFFMQMHWLTKSLRNTTILRLLAALIVVVAYGGVLEAFQSAWFTGRASEWNDFIANTCGAGAACLWAAAKAKSNAQKRI